MLFRHEMPYDATPAKVYAMLADPAFRDASCRAQDVVSVETRIDKTGTGMTVRIDQEQKTPGIPAFARKFLGATTKALQLETWSDHRNASLEIQTSTPGTMKGTITIEPAGKGALEVVELTISVGLPLIGGKLEHLMADLVRRSIEIEHRTGQAWLAGDPS